MGSRSEAAIPALMTAIPSSVLPNQATGQENSSIDSGGTQRLQAEIWNQICEGLNLTIDFLDAWEAGNRIAGEANELRLWGSIAATYKGKCGILDRGIELAAALATKWDRNLAGTANELDGWKEMVLDRLVDTMALEAKPIAVIGDPVTRIDEADGAFGAGYREAMESVLLALKGERLPAHTINSVIHTAMDAYNNNAEKIAARWEDIERILVVSNSHMPPAEREFLDNGGLDSFDYGPYLKFSGGESWLVVLNAPMPDDIARYNAALAKMSDGFQFVIRRALQLDFKFVWFDKAGRTLDGASVYNWSGEEIPL